MTMGQFFGGIDDTDPRSMQDEMPEIRRQAGKYLGMALKGDIASGQAQQQMDSDFLETALDKYPELARREREATTMQRAQDVADFGHFSPKLEAYLEKVNPGWKDAWDALNLILQGGGRSPLLDKMNTDAIGDGMSPINQRLMGLAMGELDKGGELSEDEQRSIAQDVRAMASARGLYGSDSAGINEIVNLDAARRARLYERAGFAGNIETGLEREQNADRSFATSVEGLNQGARGLVLNASGQTQNRLAPFLQLMSDRSATNPMQAASGMAMAPNTIGSSRPMINDVLGYGQDLYNTNFNADWSKQVMETNNAVALHKSMDETIASMAGGMMGGMCWVARAVYGADNPAWMRVRHWLLTRAPLWFAAFYLARGPRWAARLQEDPREADDIRETFNLILA